MAWQQWLDFPGLPVRVGNARPLVRRLTMDMRGFLRALRRVGGRQVLGGGQADGDQRGAGVQGGAHSVYDAGCLYGRG
ncbi:hypothetical protein [Streptomyces sp. NPDC041003]|uniref:hypothetical protein n=1 Tax=Streptomyces sp. NPDC041003 TaxID=3155730 RepID=UPI0034060D66